MKHDLLNTKCNGLHYSQLNLRKLFLHYLIKWCQTISNTKDFGTSVLGVVTLSQGLGDEATYTEEDSFSQTRTALGLIYIWWMKPLKKIFSSTFYDAVEVYKTIETSSLNRRITQKNLSSWSLDKSRLDRAIGTERLELVSLWDIRSSFN